MSALNDTTSLNLKEQEHLQFRSVIEHLRLNWFWLTVGVTLALLAAFLYLRYSSDYYRSSASVLITNDQNTTPANVDFSGFQLLQANRDVESEVEVLKSRTLMRKVIEKLHLTHVLTVKNGRAELKQRELFNDAPIQLVPIPNDSSLYDIEGDLEIEIKGKNAFNIEWKEDKTIGVKANEKFEIDGVEVHIVVTEHFSEAWTGKKINVAVKPIEKVIDALREALVIDLEKSEIGVLTIAMEGLSIEKNNAVIDQLLAEHQQLVIEEKNRIAENTKTFLAQRLELLDSELGSIEQQANRLKSDHGIVNVESEVTILLGQEKQLEDELLQLGVQKEMAQQMQSYVLNLQDNTRLLPVNLELDSPVLAKNIQEYNRLVLERNELLNGANDQNPIAQQKVEQLEAVKENIAKSLNAYAVSLDQQMSVLRTKLNSYLKKYANIPSYELKFKDVMREQQIHEAIYLLLLQKREENEIMLAATEGNMRIIDHAYSDGKVVSPNKKRVYLIALLVGLLIPLGITYLIRLFDTKFKEVSQIEELGLTCLGEIPLSTNEAPIETNPRSVIGEAFRMLRTNLSFMLESGKVNVLTVTSTIAGEGKTFVTMNLANTFASSGKKVAVVGMDLRAPKLMEYLELPYTVGVSNYVVNEKLTLEDISYNFPGNTNMTLIPSGEIPPNPSELLLHQRVSVLFEELKANYDLILVDSSPMGLVVDTLSLNKYIDLLVYVAKVNHLEKRQLEFPVRLKESGNMRSMAMVVNGASLNKKNGTYGYGYGYGEY